MTPPLITNDELDSLTRLKQPPEMTGSLQNLLGPAARCLQLDAELEQQTQELALADAEIAGQAITIKQLKRDYRDALDRCQLLNKQEGRLEDLLSPIWEKFPESDGETLEHTVTWLIADLEQRTNERDGEREALESIARLLGVAVTDSRTRLQEDCKIEISRRSAELATLRSKTLLEAEESIASYRKEIQKDGIFRGKDSFVEALEWAESQMALMQREMAKESK